jgi:hypothetical protein
VRNDPDRVRLGVGYQVTDTLRGRYNAIWQVSISTMRG